MKKELLLSLAVLVAAAGAACAVVLKPGSYPLEWIIPEPTEEPGVLDGRAVRLEALSPEWSERISSPVSSRALVGAADRWLIIVDQTGGSGRVYDTAWILAGYDEGEKIDLSRALKLPLSGAEGYLRSDPGADARVDMTFGKEGARVTRQVAVSLEVHLHAEGEGPVRSALALLMMRGGWAGKVATDQGEIEVRLFDSNSNGVFGDRSSLQGKVSPGKYPTPGDALQFGDASVKMFNPRSRVYLGRANLYEGRLYVFDVSPSGDTLRVAHYTGDTGKLSVRAVDGFGGPAESGLVVIYGESGVHVFEEADVKLPVGDYVCTFVAIEPRQGGEKGQEFGLQLMPNSVVKVPRNGTAVLRVGGPVSVAVAPHSAALKAKRGETVDVEIAVTVGGTRLAGVSGERYVWVNVRDAKGRLLSSGKTGFG